MTSSENGQTFNNLARWDGTQWHSLGNGLGGEFEQNPIGNTHGYDMAIFDDGSGPRLFAVGDFQFLSNVALTASVHRFAAWDRVEWEASPTTGIAQGGGVLQFRPSCLEIYDRGTGPALHVGGEARINGSAVVYTPLLRWNGSGFDIFPDRAGGGSRKPSTWKSSTAGRDRSCGSPEEWGLSTFFAEGGLATWDGTSMVA